MTKREVERVYESFRTEFAGYARKVLRGDENAVDEALQETLVRACLKQGSFEHRYGERGLHGWLLAILRNVCTEMQRTYHRDSAGDYEFEEEPDTRASGYDLLLDAMEAEEVQEVMQEVIAETELTNLEWAVLTATRLGFSNGEIARELGMGTNTVRAHVQNALPRLRRALETRSPEESRSGFQQSYRA